MSREEQREKKTLRERRSIPLVPFLKINRVVTYDQNASEELFERKEVTA
jgi:hypothetical protein